MNRTVFVVLKICYYQPHLQNSQSKGRVLISLVTGVLEVIIFHLMMVKYTNMNSTVWLDNTLCLYSSCVPSRVSNRIFELCMKMQPSQKSQFQNIT